MNFYTHEVVGIIPLHRSDTAVSWQGTKFFLYTHRQWHYRSKLKWKKS